MLISGYLNQTARFERRDGNDEWGKPKYTPFEDIPCRKEKSIKFTILNADNRSQTQTVYYTATEVKAGDMIDGEVVTATEEWVFFGGQIVGYKAVI